MKEKIEIPFIASQKSVVSQFGKQQVQLSLFIPIPAQPHSGKTSNYNYLVEQGKKTP